MESSSEDQATKASFLKSIQDTVIDPDYDLQAQWIPNFDHPYSYLEYNKYNEKRKELTKKNRSTDEQLGFLLLPSKFGLSTYLPNLDSKFMKKIQLSDCGLTESLGKFDEGVVLFTSIDVVLKLASFKRFRCAKVAVYKFMPGRTKIRMSDITNCLDTEPIDPLYDSFALELNNNLEVSQLNLNYQLRFTEIFLYEFQVYQKRNSTYQFASNCPSQTTPLTMVEFIAKRPFIIPKIVLKRKERVILPKNSLFYVANSVPSQGKKFKKVLPKGHVFTASQNSEPSYSHPPYQFFNPPRQNQVMAKKKRGRPPKVKRNPPAAVNQNIDVLGQAVMMSGLCGGTSNEQQDLGLRSGRISYNDQESNAPTCSKYLLQENETSKDITEPAEVVDSSNNDDYISSVENLDQILQGLDGQSMLSFCKDAGLDFTGEPVQQEINNPINNNESYVSGISSITDSDPISRNQSTIEKTTQGPILKTPNLSTNCVSVQTDLPTDTTDKNTQTFGSDVISTSMKSKIRDSIGSENVFDLLESLFSECACSTPKISERMKLSSTLNTPENPCHIESYQSSLLATPPLSNVNCQTNNVTPRRVNANEMTGNESDFFSKTQNTRSTYSLNTLPPSTLKSMSPKVTLRRCTDFLPSNSNLTLKCSHIGNTLETVEDDKNSPEEDVELATSSGRGSRYASPLRKKSLSQLSKSVSPLAANPKIVFRRQKNAPLSKFFLKPTSKITLQATPKVHSNIFALTDLPDASDSPTVGSSSFIFNALKMHKKVNSFSATSSRGKRKLQEGFEDRNMTQKRGNCVNTNFHYLESNNPIVPHTKATYVNSTESNTVVSHAKETESHSNQGIQGSPLPSIQNRCLFNHLSNEEVGFSTNCTDEPTQDSSKTYASQDRRVLSDHGHVAKSSCNKSVGNILPLSDISGATFNETFYISSTNPESTLPNATVNDMVPTASTYAKGTPDNICNKKLNGINETANVLKIGMNETANVLTIEDNEMIDKLAESKKAGDSMDDTLVICNDGETLFDVCGSSDDIMKFKSCGTQFEPVRDLSDVPNFCDTNEQIYLPNLDDVLLSISEPNEVANVSYPANTSTDVLSNRHVSSSSTDSCSFNSMILQNIITGQLDSGPTERHAQLEASLQTKENKEVHHSQFKLVLKQNEEMCHTSDTQLKSSVIPMENSVCNVEHILPAITENQDEKNNQLALPKVNQEIVSQKAAGTGSLLNSKILREKGDTSGIHLGDERAIQGECCQDGNKEFENNSRSNDCLHSVDSLSSINDLLEEDVNLLDSNSSVHNSANLDCSNSNKPSFNSSKRCDSLTHVKETNLNTSTVDNPISFNIDDVSKSTDINNNGEKSCSSFQVHLLEKYKLCFENQPQNKSITKTVNSCVNISQDFDSDYVAGSNNNIKSNPKASLPDAQSVSETTLDNLNKEIPVSMLPKNFDVTSDEENDARRKSWNSELSQHSSSWQTNILVSPTFTTTTSSLLSSGSTQSTACYYGKPLLKSRKTMPRTILKNWNGDFPPQDPRLKVSRSSSKPIDLKNVNWLHRWLSSINKSKNMCGLNKNGCSSNKSFEEQTTADVNLVNPASLYRINLLLNKENDCQSVYSECRDEEDALQDLIPFMTSPCHYARSDDKPTEHNSNETSPNYHSIVRRNSSISQYFTTENRNISNKLREHTGNFNDHHESTQKKMFSSYFDEKNENGDNNLLNCGINYQKSSHSDCQSSNQNNTPPYNYPGAPNSNHSYPAFGSQVSVDQSSQQTASYLDGLNLSVYDELGMNENAYLKKGKICDQSTPYKEKNNSWASNTGKNLYKKNRMYCPKSPPVNEKKSNKF